MAILKMGGETGSVGGKHAAAFTPAANATQDIAMFTTEGMPRGRQRLEARERGLALEPVQVTPQERHELAYNIENIAAWQLGRDYTVRLTPVNALMQPLGELNESYDQDQTAGYIVNVSKNGRAVDPRKLRDGLWAGLKALTVSPEINGPLTRDSIQVVDDGVYISGNALDVLRLKVEEPIKKISKSQMGDIISRNAVTFNNTGYLERFVNNFAAGIYQSPTRQF